MPVLIDFESRSRVSLKVVGGRRYWEHASTEALCCVWFDTRTAEVGVWFLGEPWPFAGRVLAAHNARGFDRFGAERYGFNAAGWIDTSQLARKAGLPGALDALGERWCGIGKDKEGSRFTRALSTVRRPPKKLAAHVPAGAWRALSDGERQALGVQTEVDAAVLERVVRYCTQDVAIIAHCWPRLSEWRSVDADVEAVDAVINDRGIAFDCSLAARLLAEDARVANEVVAAVAGELRASESEVRAAAGSPAQFCAITGAPNAQAETVERMTHPLARARMALASIARGKLRAGLARVHADGRLRDAMLYYGGHTGRWSSRGMQLQNLPRPAKVFEDLPADTRVPYVVVDGARLVDVDAFAESVLAGAQCDADGVALLVRATLHAPLGARLVAQDFASIEARATAWAAGDSDALEVFVSGRDPYKVAAATIFQVEYDAVSKQQRQIGKCAELGLGYGGGPNAFANIAHVYHIPASVLEALDLDAVVHAWRDLHAPIRSLWYACERAFRNAIEGRSSWVGPFEFVRSDDDDAVACFLPSGRPIVYHEPRPNANRRGFSYRGTKGVEGIYGGKLVENAIQALCRDLMAHALLAAERGGLRPVLTVHDEIVCEVDECEAEVGAAVLRGVMLDAPAWSAGLPIDCSGWVGRRYRK